jgi:hypothetical protein
MTMLTNDSTEKLRNFREFGSEHPTMEDRRGAYISGLNEPLRIYPETNKEKNVSTAIFSAPDVSQQLRQFALTNAAIAECRAAYMPLTIAGVNDAEGFKRVHTARIVIKNYRVDVEKVRKTLKADSLEYGRKVDAEARRIVSLLDPIEAHLTHEESVYEAAKEAIRNAARLKAEAEAAAAKEAEEARIKAEQVAETERLRVERERLSAEAFRQKAEQDRIDAANRAIEIEQKRLADIESARLRKIEDERILKEAVERARIETEQRIAREAAEKAAAEKVEAFAAEAARIRADAIRPDREKLLAVAFAVNAIEIPAVSSDASDFAKRVRTVLQQAAESIRQIVAEMACCPSKSGRARFEKVE